jgi:uncharacterized protein (TIGR02246 family)
MRILMKPALVLVCLASMVGADPAQPVGEADAAAIEEAVLDVSAQMSAAGEARDAARLFSYILENDKGAIVQNGSVSQTRSEALVQTEANLRGIQSIKYTWRRQQVTVISPVVAVLVASGESAAVTDDGRSFTTPFAQTLVFVLTQGQWRVLHAHQSSPVRR